MESRRKNIYLTAESRALLAQIADGYHGGNESQAIAAALSSYLARGDLIRNAVLDLARAAADEDFDAEQPHAVLSGLLDEVAARAIAEALVEIRASAVVVEKKLEG